MTRTSTAPRSRRSAVRARAMVATLAALIAATLGALTSANAQEATFEYTVRSGDSCGTLAERLFGHSSRYGEIHALGRAPIGCSQAAR